MCRIHWQRGPLFQAVGIACAKALWQEEVAILKVLLKPQGLEPRDRSRGILGPSPRSSAFVSGTLGRCGRGWSSSVQDRSAFPGSLWMPSENKWGKGIGLEAAKAKK